MGFGMSWPSIGVVGAPKCRCVAECEALWFRASNEYGWVACATHITDKKNSSLKDSSCLHWPALNPVANP